jgi:6,7-dimethyl-8-ribityllumazine synthase
VDVQGEQRAGGNRFAVVVSRFNPEITQGLLTGALAALEEAGAQASGHTVVWVPGAFELPLTVQRLAESGDYDAIICLGCLIKGDTMHFEYIAEAATRGIAEINLSTGVPVTFGLLTTLTDEQAEVRSRPGSGNKGREAAQAAVEMATLLRTLDQGPTA